MPSILPGHEYDIFISYRQKDNKTGWVTEFVKTLQNEIESIFKEDISIYFDQNAHDGLLETHDVEQSLKQKIKCLAFIPIISHTYCDPNSFAWQYEFLAFRNFLRSEEQPISLSLPDQRIISRLIPIKVHDIDLSEINLYEKESGINFESVDFVFRSVGVNRPLGSHEDDPKKNLYSLIYKDQINKAAYKIKDIIYALLNKPIQPKKEALSYNKAESNSVKKAIAVMPFRNIGDDKSMEYFSDGLTDELITDLSKLESLKVISNNSVVKYKGTKVRIDQIANDLNVNFILEGSVRLENNELRVTAKLIDTEDGVNIWAEKYSGTLSSVFEIQEKLSQNIIDSLSHKLKINRASILTKRPIDNFEAYQLYLQARKELQNMFSQKSNEKAIELMNECLKINGENELIYGTLMTAYLGLINLGAVSDTINYFEQVQKLLAKVLQLNTNSEYAHYASGALAFLNGDFKKALSGYTDTLKINSNHLEANMNAGITLLEVGRPEIAEPYFLKLIELDPLSGTGYGLFGYKEWNHGRFQSALPYFKKSWQLNPNDGISYWSYACALASCGLKDESLKHIDAMPEALQQNLFGKMSFLLKCGLTGNKDRAVEIIDDELIKASETQPFIARDMAGYLGMVGEIETAIQYVEKAVDLGYINYPFLAFHHPFYDPLRPEVKFIKLMDSVKKKWIGFQV